MKNGRGQKETLRAVQELLRWDRRLAGSAPWDRRDAGPTGLDAPFVREANRRANTSELQLQPSQALHRLGHQGVFLCLTLCQVRHREAQVCARVVPRHAAD